MSEVVAELRRFAFENLKLHRIEADVDPRKRSLAPPVGEAWLPAGRAAAGTLVRRRRGQRRGLHGASWRRIGFVPAVTRRGSLSRFTRARSSRSRHRPTSFSDHLPRRDDGVRRVVPDRLPDAAEDVSRHVCVSSENVRNGSVTGPAVPTWSACRHHEPWPRTGLRGRPRCDLRRL